MKYFVISDIHGSAQELNAMLEKYNPDEEKLIFLGDYIDRGTGSLEVLETIMTMYLLHGQDRVKVLRGNHDNLLLELLQGDKIAYSTWINNGGVKMATEILDLEYPTTKPLSVWTIGQCKMVTLINKHISDKVEFLKNCTLLSYQDDQFLFTHAGFDSLLEDWRDTNDSDFMWIRKHYLKPNVTGYINIFGHTRTSIIRGDESNKAIWVSPCKAYIGIDGGCSYGGQLNAIVLNSENPQNLTVHVVKTGETEVQTQNIVL